jgi:SWI/SNF-related matrix-associated actin-dependent regulator 1 of chromatin subfamily A
MTRPYQFQKEDIHQIQKFGGRALLALDMGLGKTSESLFFIRWFLPQGPTVIVCPASLKWNWALEAKKHTNISTIILEGMKPSRERINVPRDSAVIVNYDIAGAWLERLQQLKPTLVILDECHMIKSRKAKRYRAVKELCRNVPYLLALSGTPILNRPYEIWTTLNLLRPDLFPSAFHFGTRFCQGHLGPFGWDFSGASNLDELNQILSSNLMIRRRKVDVLQDLPPKTRTVVPVDIDDRPQYEEAERQYLKWLIKHKPERASRALSAERLTQIGYLRRLAGELKLKSVANWIEDFLSSTDQKLVLFGIHKNVLRPLTDRFKNISVLVDGEVTGKDRQIRFDSFNSDNSTRLFLGNIRAAGQGWSCRTSSTVAFAEMDWTPGAHLQAEDRTHGISRGIEGVGVQIIYLVARGTLEEHLVKIIQSKQKIIGQAVDGGGDAESLDVVELLENALLEGKDNDYSR